MLAVSIVLSPEEHCSIRLISEHDLSVVHRRLLDEGALDEGVVDEAIDEYRRYMILYRLSDRLGLTALPMCSEEVDAVWHFHLVCTRDYAAFCERALGRFAHHEPSVVGGHEASVLAFFRAYAEVFGEVGRLWRVGFEAQALPPLRQALAADEFMLESFRAALPELVEGLGLEGGKS